MKIIKYTDVITADGYSEYLKEIRDKLPIGAFEFASNEESL